MKKVWKEERYIFHVYCYTVFPAKEKSKSVLWQEENHCCDHQVMYLFAKITAAFVPRCVCLWWKAEQVGDCNLNGTWQAAVYNEAIKGISLLRFRRKNKKFWVWMFVILVMICMLHCFSSAGYFCQTNHQSLWVKINWGRTQQTTPFHTDLHFVLLSRMLQYITKS